MFVLHDKLETPKNGDFFFNFMIYNLILNYKVYTNENNIISVFVCNNLLI